MTEDDLAPYRLDVEGTPARLKTAGVLTAPDGDGVIRQWVTMTIIENGGEEQVLNVKIEATAVLLLARLAAQQLASAKGSEAAATAGEVFRGVSGALEKGASTLFDAIGKVLDEAGKKSSGDKDKPQK